MLQISCFKDVWDTENPELKKQCDADYAIQAIKENGKIKDMVYRIRNMPDKNQRKRSKRFLPVVMWQGLFNRRSDDGCVALSSLVCIDIDNKSEEDLRTIMSTIVNWPFIYAFFRSPSGDGLKVIVKTDNYDIGYYGNCYRQVEQLFVDFFGITPDGNCENIGRACYMSHDPELYHNPTAIPWPYEHKPEFDKISSSNSSSSQEGNYVTPALSPGEMFMAKLNAAMCPLTDEQIMKILDIRWHKFPENYKDGNRTKSIFVQARTLCLAGIVESKAIEYLKEQFVPTGYSEDKLVWEAKRAYEKTSEMFGTERSKYKTYNEYKKTH